MISVFMERWGLARGNQDPGRTQEKGLKWNCDCEVFADAAKGPTKQRMVKPSDTDL